MKDRMKILPPREGTTFRIAPCNTRVTARTSVESGVAGVTPLPKMIKGPEAFKSTVSVISTQLSSETINIRKCVCRIVVAHVRSPFWQSESWLSRRKANALFPNAWISLRLPDLSMDQKAGTSWGLPGGGPEMVITNLGCYEFSDGEMVLTSLHPGCAVEEVRENTGWDIRISPQLTTTEIPSDEELRILREDLDPSHLFI